MVEMNSQLSYTLRVSEKEFKLVAKCLAVVGGVEGPAPSADDRAQAAQLNARLLELSVADLQEKVKVAQHKRKPTEDA